MSHSRGAVELQVWAHRLQVPAKRFWRENFHSLSCPEDKPLGWRCELENGEVLYLGETLQEAQDSLRNRRPYDGTAE